MLGKADSSHSIKIDVARRDRVLVLILLLVCLVFCIWGNGWGAPRFWHPDEVTQRASMMVSNRTLDPGAFQYGGLQYYIVSLSVVVPLKIYYSIFSQKPESSDVYSYKLWSERYKKNLIRLARTVTAVMSTLVVFITFVIGTILYDKKVGVLSGIFLTLSSSFILLSHFATVDGPANFWFWSSCLFSLLVWKKGWFPWYLPASISAGFAFGTKIDRLVILFPVITAVLFSNEGNKFKKTVTVIAISIAAFVLANPLIIVSPFQYLDGTTRDLFFNMLRPEDETSIYTAISYIVNGLGLPIFLTSIISLIYGIYDIYRGKDLKENLWLIFTFLPYYIIFSFKFGYYYYFPIMFPAMVILAAKLCVDIVFGLPDNYKFAAKTVIAFIVIFSLLNTIVAILQLTGDSRYQAGRWIKENVAVGSTIEVIDRGPIVSEEQYKVVYPLKDKEFYDVAFKLRKELAGNSAYQGIRSTILNLEKLSNHYIGFPVRKQSYQAWFDRWTAKYENRLYDVYEEENGEIRNSDYVVVIDYLQPERLSELKSPGSGFELVAHFYYTSPFGIQYPILFVNPHVYIFRNNNKIMLNNGFFP